MKPLLAAPLLLAGATLLPATGLQEPTHRDLLERPSVRVDLELLAASGDAPEMDVLTAPVLVTLEGERAQLQVQNQKAYVAGFDVRTEADGSQVVADPVVETFLSGVSMDLRAHRDRQGRWGGALAVTETDLGELREFEALLGEAEVTLQVPVAESHTRHLFLEPRAEGLWYVNLGPDAEGHQRLLRVRMTQVSENPGRLR